MRSIILWITMVATVFVLAGCAGIDRSYTRADRLTFETVAPRFERYIQEDESLDAAKRQTILYTLELWDRRIEEAERVERIR